MATPQVKENMVDLHATLIAKLNSQKTVTELFKLAASDDFKRDAQSLPADLLTDLRKHYKSVQTALDGKVKLEEFDGQVIAIVDIDYWYSEEWGNEGVTLKYHPEKQLDRTYKSLTSSVVWLRFAKGLGDVLPTETAPVRVQIHLEPVRDSERARQGQKIWKIKRLPNREEQSGLPF